MNPKHPNERRTMDPKSNRKLVDIMKRLGLEPEPTLAEKRQAAGFPPLLSPARLAEIQGFERVALHPHPKPRPRLELRKIVWASPPCEHFSKKGG